jgi:hypothetical protein
MICPNCGGAQNNAKQCKYCGVTFDRLHKADPASTLVSKANKTTPGLFGRLFRRCCWASLIILIIALILILRMPSPPQIEVAPDAVQTIEAKVKEFQSSMGQGRQSTLRMNESELNGWMDANLTTNRQQGPDASQSHNVDTAIDPEKNAAELEQAQSTVRDVKAKLIDDSVKLYATVDFHGKDLLLEVDGRVFVQDGYLRLKPTGGKMNSLPLPSSALQALVERIFNSPQNKEKFKLPSGIEDIRIDSGVLSVISQ